MGIKQKIATRIYSLKNELCFIEHLAKENGISTPSGLTSTQLMEAAKIKTEIDALQSILTNDINVTT